MANHSHPTRLRGTPALRRPGYARSVFRCTLRVALLFGILLVAACGGGGGGGSRPSTNATPPPTTAPAQPQTIHRIIGFAVGVALETVPAGNPPALPPGGADLGPVPGAAIVYPDGSVQYADLNGGYDPTKSSFAQTYRLQLNSNAQLQPTIILSDPLHTAIPSMASVSAYSSAQQIQARHVTAKHQVIGRPSAGRQINIAGVILLPETATLIAGNPLALNAVGVDTNNNVVDISNATITYSADYGTVLPFANSTQAYYVPPTVQTGQIVDSVTVTVSVDSVNAVSATNQITVLAPSSAASISGSLSDGGAAVADGIAVFAQAGLPKFFMPSYSLALADGNGNYSTQLPASSLFSLGIGEGSPPNFGVFVAQGANGSTSYRSGGAGQSGRLDLSVQTPRVPFSALPLALQTDLPNWVTFVRDAWYAGFSFSRQVFAAGSGIQPLLAATPQTLSAPSPANPTPVGSGELATWCYQWQPLAGIPTLVLIENTDTQCTQPGNEAYTIAAASAPAGGTASYQYVHYYSHTAFPTTGAPDVVTGSLLVDSGTWTQNLTTGSGGAVQSDIASVSAQLYDELDQVLGQPVYNDTLSYQYTLGAGGLATEQFSNGQRTSAYDGTLIASYNGTRTQLAPYSSCTTGATACTSISANVQEDGYNYSVSGTRYGDGSRSFTYQNSSPGDSSEVTLNVVGDRLSNTSGCMVCSSSPGVVYDVDGITPIATFTVSNAGLVQVSIYDTPSGSTTLGPDVIDTLAFVL